MPTYCVLELVEPGQPQRVQLLADRIHQYFPEVVRSTNSLAVYEARLLLDELQQKDGFMRKFTNADAKYKLWLTWHKTLEIWSYQYFRGYKTLAVGYLGRTEPLDRFYRKHT